MLTINKCGVVCMVLVTASVGATPTATAETQRKITAAAELSILPSGMGTLTFEAGNTRLSKSLETSLGLAGQIDLWLTSEVSVTVAPRIALDVKAQGGRSGATQYDLVGRVQGRWSLSAETQGFLYGGLGLSMIAVPNDDETPSGPLIDVGLGVRHAIATSHFVQGSAGYAVGFQGGDGYELRTSALRLGVGLGTTF